jgi:hypothetical protein
VVGIKEEESIEKEKEGKVHEHEEEEPTRGPLRVVNTDGVSLNGSDDDEADDINTGNSTRKPERDSAALYDIGVALSC